MWLWCSSNTGFGGMWSTSLLLSGPLWSGEVAPDRVLYMDQIELKIVVMLNWTVCNRNVLTLKLYTYGNTELLEIELFWNSTELFWHLSVCKQKV